MSIAQPQAEPKSTCFDIGDNFTGEILRILPCFNCAFGFKWISVSSIFLAQFLTLFFSFVFRVRVKVLHTFVVKCVALLTTKVIMNVIASMEAPRNPAKNCMRRAQFENFYFLEPKRAREPTGLEPVNNVLLPLETFVSFWSKTRT